jgi:hypothetical protein
MAKIAQLLANIGNVMKEALLVFQTAMREKTVNTPDLSKPHHCSFLNRTGKMQSLPPDKQ